MTTQLTDSDKAFNAFEAQNPSIELWILMTSDGVPFKFSQSSLEYPAAVRYAGLIYDLMLFTKKTFDDFKKTPNSGNVVLRVRLKNGKEFIVSQEHDFYLITLQICKVFQEEVEEGKK